MCSGPSSALSPILHGWELGRDPPPAALPLPPHCQGQAAGGCGGGVPSHAVSWGSGAEIRVFGWEGGTGHITWASGAGGSRELSGPSVYRDVKCGCQGSVWKCVCITGGEAGGGSVLWVEASDSFFSKMSMSHGQLSQVSTRGGGPASI